MSSPHLWPQWLHLWKTSMAQTRSVTPLPIQTLFQGRPRMHWLSHTGKFCIVMRLLSRVMFTTDFTVWSFCLHHHSHISRIFHINNTSINSPLWTYRWAVYLSLCIYFFTCMHVCMLHVSMIVSSLYSLLLSCFSSLGNSLSLVGSALSDRDVTATTS